MFLVFILIAITAVNGQYKYNTEWFEVPLDHFGYQRNETFKIKYLINNQTWEGNGPIFFYTGNEGQIEAFAQHSGFIWETAPEFNALVVFAEHRYYGASMPFGPKSLDKEHIGYLTSSQALADYAQLITHLQGSNKQIRYPVIAFGGSYGGMLAAYIRMKYPHLVAGAIAASAPIHMFSDMVPCGAYDRIATSSYRIDSCAQNIKKSWQVIRNFTADAKNATWLQKQWRLCNPVSNSSDTQQLIDFLKDMYGTLAMVNYPFASDFLMPLPAYPVRNACQYLVKNLTGQQLLEGIGQVLDMYVNYEKKTKCVDYKNFNYGNLDASGWDYQACTEMVMPMCSNGIDDMFEPVSWDLTKYSDECFKKYGVKPRPNDAWIQYGGDKLQAASNIVFSNGLLDPWAGGGILSSVSESLKAVVITNGAHHLDLMPSHPEDPVEVKVARDVHKQNIRKWIRRFQEQS